MPRSAVVPEEIPRHQSVCQYNCCENSKSRPFSRALLLLCTQILSYKCRQCHSKAVDGQKTEPFHLCVGPIARHCHLSECIDIGLHDYVCKRNDRVLHSGRQSDLDDLDKGFLCQNGFFESSIHSFPLSAAAARNKGVHSQSERSRLQRRTSHSCMKSCDKQQIQHQIDHRRYDQIIQRMSAVSHSLQNSHQDIVHHKS